MQYFSYLHFAAAQVYIILAVVVFFRDRKALLNRLCSSIFFCFFIWSFSWVFIQNPHVSRETAIFFENIGSIGWLLFSPFFFWFSVEYAKIERHRLFPFFLVLLFSIPVVLIIRQWTGPNLFSDHLLHWYGWNGIWRRSIWTYLFFGHYFTTMCACLYLIWNVSRKSEYPPLKRQSIILMVSVLIPLVLGTLSNTVLPILNVVSLPPLADIFILSWAGGMTYAVWKFRLLSITPFIAAEQIVAAMKDLLLLLDTHGNILSFNQSTIDVLEYSREELEGKPVEMIFGDLCVDKAAIRSAIRFSSLREYQTMVTSKSGISIPVSLSTVTLPDQGVVCVAHDVSLQHLRTELLQEEKDKLQDKISSAFIEQKKTTTQLRFEISERIRAVKARKESEIRFRTIFEFAPDGFYLMDDSGRFFDGNREAERITGYKKMELIGENFKSLELLPESEFVKAGVAHSKSAQGQPTGPDEFTLVRKNGEEIAVEISTHPISIGERKLTLGIARDISQRKKNEEEKRLLTEELNQAQKMEAVGRLAGGIAHDFNNLLGGILGYADILRIKLASAMPAESIMADKIASIARQASQLTSQLLAFARKGKYQVEVIDIHAAAIDVIGILERTIDKKIQIITDFHAQQPTVLGDRSQLQNAFLNLGVNSRDAMPEGGSLTFRTDTVEISEESACSYRYKVSAGTYIRLSVIDTGCGMDDTTKEHAFDPFFTTKGPGKGTGLGLASVYGTIKNHNGFIELSSDKGKGTTMTLCFPVTISPVENKPEREELPVKTGRSGVIMFVDDEKSIREMACEALQLFGFTTIPFGRAGSAIKYYRSHSKEINLVILDLSMPEQSGDDCFRAMKAINSGIKAIISSGHSNDEMIGQLLAEGVCAFLPKPFDLDKLAKTVDAAMGNEITS